MPSNTVLFSGPAVGAAQIPICPTLVCPYLQCPQLLEPVHFLLWELLMTFYIFHRHRVYIGDHLDLTCSLYSWWDGFRSSSLATLPLGFNCGFISTSACGLSTGVYSWGCPGGLGFAPWGPGVEAVHSAAWDTGFWQHQVLRGVGS